MASTSATLADVVGVLEDLYPPDWAEPWDAVGLVCGDPEAAVRRVLFAIDPVAVVADEAVRLDADLLVTHHPLFLRPVHGVAATSPKGRLVHTLMTNGVALHVAHTNADVAEPGVSDALAEAVGLSDLRPIETATADPLDKVVTFVPHADAARVLDALADAGAGAIGDYTRCAWTVEGIGTFRPEQGAQPTIGEVGRIEEVPETRIEMVLPRARRREVINALLASHPYEEPAYDVFALAELPGRRGLGRIGVLASPEPLGAFVARVAATLPVTAAGLRVAGDPSRVVRTIAVCGGAGDSLLGAVAASGVDAYLTADLRHHPTSEAREGDGPALVDAAHWATEWPWLPIAARALAEGVRARTGVTVETAVSSLVTDAWTVHVPSSSAPMQESNRPS
jgi:dinuclear metal center YbgI/SA1388 family protein